MLLLQQARLMQAKIPRPLKYKVTSIGNQIQRRRTASTNNKNNKDVFTFFLTQHPLSIIVRHKQKKALLRNGKIHVQKTHFFTTMDPKRTIKISWKVLYAGWGPTACYCMTFAGLYISSSPRAVATQATTKNQFYLKQWDKKALIL